MAAFVDGFGWLHRGADTTVHFDPRYFPTDGPVRESLRAAIEALVLDPPRCFLGEIAPGYENRVNG